MYWMKINNDSSFECIEMDAKLDNFYREINCDTIQIVRVLPGKPWFEPFRLILDDNGKVYNKPINVLATYLYAYEYDTIVGDVLLGRVNDEGDDIVGFDTREQAESALNIAWSTVAKEIYK